MAHAHLIVPANGGIEIVMEDSETLVYQIGTVDVPRDTPVETADPDNYTPPQDAEVVGNPVPIEFDEDDNPTLWQVWVRALETVPHIVGGWMVVSEPNPEPPLNTVVIAVRSTEAYLTTLHDRLFALDNCMGIVPGTEIQPDATE